MALLKKATSQSTTENGTCPKYSIRNQRQFFFRIDSNGQKLKRYLEHFASQGLISKETAFTEPTMKTGNQTYKVPLNKPLLQDMSSFA